MKRLFFAVNKMQSVNVHTDIVKACHSELIEFLKNHLENFPESKVLPYSFNLYLRSEPGYEQLESTLEPKWKTQFIPSKPIIPTEHTGRGVNCPKAVNVSQSKRGR